MGVKGGEEIAEESKGAALSKHQIKKAKKKVKGNGGISRLIYCTLCIPQCMTVCCLHLYMYFSIA